MQHSSKLGESQQDLSYSSNLTHFYHLEPSRQLCKVCKAGYEATLGTTLLDMNHASKLGCQDCKIRLLGVLKAMKWDSDRPYGGLVQVDFQFEGFVTVHVIEERHLTDPENQSAIPGRNLFNVEILTRYGEQPSSSEVVGIGRDILQTRKETYLELLSEWLTICIDRHQDCAQQASPLPSRVIDVGIGGSLVFLYIASRESASYTALSHCWGKAPIARTTEDNYLSRQKGILLADLPQTFCDAIMVTRGLGIRYLWIDSLCIIQDSESDWQSESGNMAAIYSNAYIVIGADRSADCNGGFLDPASRKLSESEPFGTIENRDGSISTIYARAKDALHEDICDIRGHASIPLSKRAWTLQEQLLSSRMVHFTDSELIWECGTKLCCECMEIERQKIDYGNARLKFRNSLLSKDPEARFEIWWRILASYCRRDITYETDLLPALSGIATQMQQHGAGDYLAGIWRDNLPLALLWDGGGEFSERIIPYRAPTWSWASLRRAKSKDNDSRFGPDTVNFRTKNLEILHTTVINAHCSAVGKDTRGAVASGYITLSGPLVEVTWFSKQKMPSSRLKKAVDSRYDLVRMYESSNIRAHAIFDFNLTLAEYDTLHCLLIGEQDGIGNDIPIGLILKKARGNEDSWERVGTFSVYDWEFSVYDWKSGYNKIVNLMDFFKNGKETLVTIV